MSPSHHVINRSNITYYYIKCVQHGDSADHGDSGDHGDSADNGDSAHHGETVSGDLGKTVSAIQVHHTKHISNELLYFYLILFNII